MSRSTADAPDKTTGGAMLPTRAMLIALMAGASLAFSMAFACATPFAASAAVSVLRMKPRDAVATVTLAWAVNQADGFLFMHYPWTWDCFGWGAAIWVAAMAATLAAQRLFSPARPSLAASCGALAVAFIAYEATLFAATILLPSSAAAFAPATIVRLLGVDIFAFVLLSASIGGLRAIARIVQPNTDRSFGRHVTMARMSEW